MTQSVRQLTVNEVCQVLNCGEQTVRRLIAAGKLRVVRLGRRVRVRETELERFAAERERRGW